MQINEQIRDAQLRIVGSDGEQLGLMSARQALAVAEEQGLDLVKIAPTAQPPVCKLMDYGKYRFEQSKKEKEARKNQHTVELKELRLSLNIDEADVQTKARHAVGFLKEGHKVKVTIRFRGREMGHTGMGQELMARFAERCAEAGTVERIPKLEGRSMMMFMTPKNDK